MATRTKQSDDSDELGSGISLSEMAKRFILNAIQEGDYEPGARILEREIAETLNISRTPVREAIRQLQTDDLLILTPHTGVVVASLSLQQIVEIYAVRIVLEELAARLAVQYASDPEIELMREILNKSESCADDLKTFATLNKEFHNTIYRASRNQYILKILDSMRATFALMPDWTYSVDNRAREAIAEHRALLEAIAARDADRAGQASRVHMEGAQQARIKVCIERMT